MKSYQTSASKEKARELISQICLYAKTQNKNALDALIQSGTCLSFFQGDNNAILLLAREGDASAVNYLLTNYKQNPDHAIKGYALGGHSKYVNELLANGASIDQAAQGYAQGGYHAEVLELLKQGAKIDVIVKGYAIGGHSAQVNEFLDPTTLHNYEIALQGYAMGGHVNQVSALLAEIHKTRPNEVYYSAHALSGYALAGRLSEVNALLASIDPTMTGEAIQFAEPYLVQAYGIDKEKFDKMSFETKSNMIKHLAIGGHANLVTQFLTENQTANQSIQALNEMKATLFSAYLQGGHLVEAAAIKKNLGAIDPVLISPHWPIQAIDTFVDETRKLDTSEGIIQIAAECQFAGYDELRPMPQQRLLRLMTFVNNDKLREEIADTALSYAVDEDDQHETPSPAYSHYNHLYQKAIRQHQLMKIYQLNYRQITSLSIPGALIWMLQGQLIILQLNNMKLRIPHEIFLEIASHVLGVPYQEAKALTEAMQTKFYGKTRLFDPVTTYTPNNNNAQLPPVKSAITSSPSPTNDDTLEGETGAQKEKGPILRKRKHC